MSYLFLATTNQELKDGVATQEIDLHGDPAHASDPSHAAGNQCPEDDRSLESDQARVKNSRDPVSAIFNVGPVCYSSEIFPDLFLLFLAG